MPISSYFSDALLNHGLGSGTLFKPVYKCLALMTTAPTKTGGGVEISTSGTAYVRKDVTFTLVPGNASTPSKAVLTAPVEFPVASTNWGTITHYAVYDLASGGNLLFFGPLDVAKNIGAGDVFRQGTLSIDLN